MGTPKINKPETLEPDSPEARMAVEMIRDTYEVKMFGREDEVAEIRSDTTTAKIEEEINRRLYHSVEATKPWARRMLNKALDTSFGAAIEATCLTAVAVAATYYAQAGVRSWWDSDEETESIGE